MSAISEKDFNYLTSPGRSSEPSSPSDNPKTGLGSKIKKVLNKFFPNKSSDSFASGRIFSKSVDNL